MSGRKSSVCTRSLRCMHFAPAWAGPQETSHGAGNGSPTAGSQQVTNGAFRLFASRCARRFQPRFPVVRRWFTRSVRPSADRLASTGWYLSSSNARRGRWLSNRWESAGDQRRVSVVRFALRAPVPAPFSGCKALVHTERPTVNLLQPRIIKIFENHKIQDLTSHLHVISRFACR